MSGPLDPQQDSVFGVTRRKFVGSGAGAAAIFSIVPAHILGREGKTSPNEKLNIAGVGIGGMGAAQSFRVRGGEHRGPL